MLKAELKAFANSIGVHHLGVGRAEPFPDVEALLARQKAEGAYPKFTEKEIELRTRPARLLPDAKSIISIAVSYLTPDDHHPKAGDAPRGLVSRYAWGDDYHPILAEKLEQIAAFLAARVTHPVEYRAYVDTGPPVDRAFSVRAGIGWYGKNACVYVPGHGSWVFLAQIVTNVELEPDPEISKSCGACDRCIRACPTGAIERPYWVNPEKCLSYITQMPGMIPKEYRRAMGRHLFGCDICQLVCPWNWEAEAAGDERFRPSAEIGPRPDLIKLLTITKSEFNRLFGPTAMHWRGKKIIQRNACICLGNIGDPASLPPLIEAMRRDPKPVVRASAAWAIGQIGGETAHAALKEALAHEKDALVLREIEDACADLERGKAALQTLKVGKRGLDDEDDREPAEEVVLGDRFSDPRRVGPADDHVHRGHTLRPLGVHDEG